MMYNINNEELSCRFITTFFILIVLFFSYNGVAFIRFLKRYVIIIDIKGGYKHGRGWIASRYGTIKFFFKE